MTQSAWPPQAFRLAKKVSPEAPISATQTGERLRILIVDLNNFAAFPTLTIGILVAALRKSGHQVHVLCPLAFGVPAAERERQETWLDQVRRRAHMTEAPAFRIPRNIARNVYYAWTERPHPTVVREIGKAFEQRPDVVLLSAYFQHFETVREIGRLALKARLPVILGGPMFNNFAATEVWRQIPGIVCVVGAESDLSISPLVEAVRDGKSLMRFPGLVLPNGQRTPAPPPFRNLDDVLTADFSDFPWERYRVRVVPIMAGRGCQWDRCTFCSDVVTVSGRTFRTRSVQNVLLEMQEQSRRCATTNFLFLDLKLNSYPDMIRGIAADIQSYVFGAEWLGTVHVDLRKDNGLSRSDLKAAALSGMRRINFGLESGSQDLLDRMKKGTSVERNSKFIHDAYEVGLSVRCSMFKGYPSETVDDVDKTVKFLEDHRTYIDRIRFSDFSLLDGTPIYNHIKNNNLDQPDLRVTRVLDRKARAEYVVRRPDLRAYSRALGRLMRIIHEINRRPIRDSARQFDGLM